VIRVLLADDQPAFREGLRELLATADEIEVAGEAANGAEAVEAALRLAPDVVLMDIRMPKLDGIAAVRALRERRPDACVLMLTTFDDDELVAAAIEAGAMGYLLKGTPVDDIVDILHLALRGYTAIGRGVAPPRPRSRTDREVDHALRRSAALGKRETEIWGLIGEGLTNREVAERLALTEGTVKNYVSSLLGTLGVRHRTQAALLWRQRR